MSELKIDEDGESSWNTLLIREPQNYFEHATYDRDETTNRLC